LVADNISKQLCLFGIAISRLTQVSLAKLNSSSEKKRRARAVITSVPQRRSFRERGLIDDWKDWAVPRDSYKRSAFQSAR